MRQYTAGQTVLANLPYAAMVAVGAATIAMAFGLSAWSIAGGVLYVLYGVGGAFWIMVFVCPYCAYYATKACPCGYGSISARFAGRGDRECFPEKFRRHIPVIVPLWLIPVACGVVGMWLAFSWWLLALTCIFAIDAYVVLPLVSRKNCCAECPQVDACPWMGSKAQSAAVCGDEQQGGL